MSYHIIYRLLAQSIILRVGVLIGIVVGVFSFHRPEGSRSKQSSRRYGMESMDSLISNHDVYLKYFSITFTTFPISTQIPDFCSTHDLWSSVQKFGLSGAAAGACRALSRGLTFPFDTIKTFEQSGEWNKENQPTQKRKINYFNGILTTVASAVPSNAVFLITYKCLLLYTPCLFPALLDSAPTSKLAERLAASIVASFPANAIKIPSEVVKQRAQLLQSSDIGRIISDAVREKGIGGLYTGGYAQLLREIPYNAFQMAIYDMLQDLSTTSVVSDVAVQRLHLTLPLLSALLGLIAASFAALFTQPADVIKTRLMTAGITTPSTREDLGAQGLGEEGRLDKNEDRFLDSVIRSVREIFQSSGVPGFFVGLGPRLMIVSIGGASYFYASSLIETYLDITIK
eukprot:gene24608-33076_t